MNRTIFSKKRVALFFIIVLVGAFCFSFFTVNAKFPPGKEIIHPFGERISYKNMEFQVKRTEILDYDQFAENEELIHALQGPNPEGEDVQNTKIVLITAEFYNPTDQPQKLDLTPFWLEAGNFSSQADDSLILYYNPSGLILNKKEKRIIKLPVPLKTVFFTGSEWETVKDRKFSLVYTLYPEKNIVKIVAERSVA